MKKRTDESAYIADVEVIHRKEIFCKFPPEYQDFDWIEVGDAKYINADYSPEELPWFCKNSFNRKISSAVNSGALLLTA